MTLLEVTFFCVVTLFVMQCTYLRAKLCHKNDFSIKEDLGIEKVVKLGRCVISAKKNS